MVNYPGAKHESHILSNESDGKQIKKNTCTQTYSDLLTKLTDVIIGVGLWHGSDGEKGAAVSPQSFTQDVLSQVYLRGPQSL